MVTELANARGCGLTDSVQRRKARPEKRALRQAERGIDGEARPYVKLNVTSTVKRTLLQPECGIDGETCLGDNRNLMWSPAERIDR